MSNDDKTQKKQPQQQRRKIFTIYPFCTATLITASLVLSVYSTSDCQFLTVNIGFIPVNEIVDSEFLTIGFWKHARFDTNTAEICQEYPEVKKTSLIEGDDNWFIAQFGAISAILAAFFSALIQWLMICGGMPSKKKSNLTVFFLTLLSFIAEGCKFSFYLIRLCQSKIWLASVGGSIITRQQAQSCTPQKGSIATVVACGAYLVSACLIGCYMDVGRKPTVHVTEKEIVKEILKAEVSFRMKESVSFRIKESSRFQLDTTKEEKKNDCGFVLPSARLIQDDELEGNDDDFFGRI